MLIGGALAVRDESSGSGRMLRWSDNAVVNGGLPGIALDPVDVMPKEVSSNSSATESMSRVWVKRSRSPAKQLWYACKRSTEAQGSKSYTAVSGFFRKVCVCVERAREGQKEPESVAVECAVDKEQRQLPGLDMPVPWQDVCVSQEGCG